MTTDTTARRLAFGYNRGIPETVKTAWGARVIAPNDMPYDRQDLFAESDEAKQKLIAWLNGGALRTALDWLYENRYAVRPDRDEKIAIYEDETGVIVGNTNASRGYVYLAGWLKETA
jgi:hypothetical protein